MSLAEATAHQALMDRVYRYERHFYDLTRKYYLLDRDRLIEELDPAGGDRVLEIGSGTGRNLVACAKRYGDAKLFGVDISSEMLSSAAKAVGRAGQAGRVRLAQCNAATSDPRAVFRVDGFDRVFFSYTLSMIPDHAAAIEAAIAALRPGGRLHIVDFGDQRGLPRFFRAALFRWLAWFHVRPKSAEFTRLLKALADRDGHRLAIERPRRGYVFLAWIEKRDT